MSLTGLRVTVPGSTSNLGAGFDCVGLALDRYLTASFELADTMRVERLGTLADVDGDDLAATILLELGLRGTLILDSTIPVGRGLGSSAAATVAALAIAAVLRGADIDYEDVLRQATSLEGHPDNAAPSLLGGLIAVVSDGTGVRALQLHLSEAIGFVFAAPQAIVSTKAARQALPEQVPHVVAARSIARSVALIEGLAEGDAELLRIGFGDELHVPYRIGMIPGGAPALDAAIAAGAWAATISGSGSGMIAACARGSEEPVRAAMAAAFEAATAHEPIAFVAQPDFSGVQIERL
ncbi:MAG: homoserine kinase [Gemmatimonadota bacterium]